jgi:predicted nicotinamide N-methyase
MSSEEVRRPHPTARAFFDALDQQQQSKSNGAAKASSRQSDFIKKRTLSLGWRSRYTQAEQYPVSIVGGGQEQQFTIRQVQRGEIDGTYGTGATVWPASMVLLKYLEKHPGLVENKSVVDLGAGTGVTSLAAAICGAERVICTDGIASVVNLARDNVDSAHLVGIDKKRIEVAEYWWGSGSLNEEFDVVLVSDCVLPKLYPIAPLVDGLVELMKPNSVAILSYEHRHFAEYNPSEKFRELATAKGLQTKVVGREELDPVYSVDDIQIWLVTNA